MKDDVTLTLLDSAPEKKKFPSVLDQWMWILPLFLVFLFSVLFLFAHRKGDDGVRQFVVATLALLFGVALQHADYSFSGGFRSFLREGKGEKFRGIIGLFFLTSVATALVYEFVLKDQQQQTWLYPKRPVAFSDVPQSTISIILGSFLFGIGMQLSNCCASGVLWAVGAGKIRAVVSLLFFIVGATFASINPLFNFWNYKGEIMESTSTIEQWNVFLALLLQFGLLGGVFVFSLVVENHMYGEVGEGEWKWEFPKNVAKDLVKGICRGGWNIHVGSAFITVLQVLLLLFAGHFFGIMGVFPILGCKFLKLFGVGCDKWDYFQKYSPFPTSLICSKQPICDYILIDAFIVLGSFLAAAAASSFGRGNTKKALSLRPILAAVCGGTLLGIGSRFAAGCNIGSLYSGLSSYSFHSYLWLAGGLLGNWIGLFIRPLFKLD